MNLNLIVQILAVIGHVVNALLAAFQQIDVTTAAGNTAGIAAVQGVTFVSTRDKSGAAKALLFALLFSPALLAQDAPLIPPAAAEIGAPSGPVSPAGDVHKHLPPDVINLLQIEKSAPAAYLLASVADSTTDWQFRAGGRDYRFSPGQQVAMAAGGVGVGLLIRHLWPKSARYVDIGFSVAAGIRGYRAIASARAH